MSVASLVKEPLVHFALIGAAIFGAYGLVAEPEPEPDAGNRRIVITEGDVGRLAGYWEKRRLRAPTAEELDGLIDAHLREEVLYREALALGLDRDDAVIRRLLRQKYEFVTQDLAVAPEPDPEDLRAWHEANRDRYRSAPRVSFVQVHFDLDRRGARGERDAMLMLASLRDGASPSGAGDGRMLEAGHRDVTAQDVAARFGQEFADAVLGLERGVWSGPIRSGYGLHLIRIDERTDGNVLPFEAVERQVRSDWTYGQRQKANDALYARLLDRYEVVIEGTPGHAGKADAERP